jgi:hypothetical protein
MVAKEHRAQYEIIIHDVEKKNDTVLRAGGGGGRGLKLFL